MVTGDAGLGELRFREKSKIEIWRVKEIREKLLAGGLGGPVLSEIV